MDIARRRRRILERNRKNRLKLNTDHAHVGIPFGSYLRLRGGGESPNPPSETKKRHRSYSASKLSKSLLDKHEVMLLDKGERKTKTW